IGLASVNYRLALKKFDNTLVPSDTDQQLLEASLEMLSRASSATHQPPLSDIQTKIDFEKGQVLFMQAYTDEHPNFDKAAAEFYSVVNEYEASNRSNYRIQELTAEAYARLALIYDLIGNAPLSLDTYRQACELLAPSNPRKKQFRERMDTLSKATGQTAPTSAACP
ncbi:MAG TPA: hypothetical protein P5280_03465, partial [Cyclobacteriaceae bacterium]|nr:hypothetical protein [Cyclobacteriaceae bacterium]